MVWLVLIRDDGLWRLLRHSMSIPVDLMVEACGLCWLRLAVGAPKLMNVAVVDGDEVVLV
jgi:hypothetical protein